MDWDDLRIFLHLARTGRMAGAGRALGMDDTTVGRRVARLETELDVALVARAGRRTVITERGLELARAAEEMESVVMRRIADLGAAETEVAGRVRVGAPEGLGIGYLARHLAALSAANPKLETELVALPRTYSLASREVDIAVTLDRPVRGQLSVKKLTDYTLDLYGTAAYFTARPRPQNLSELKTHLLTGYIPDLLFTDALDFSAPDTGLPAAPAVRSTSVIAQLNAVLSGAAIGVLPTYLAAPHAALEPLLTDTFRLTRSYWISIHDDVRRLGRIRAVVDSLTASVRSDRAVFLRT